MISAILLCLFAYVLGSVPTGYWLVKLVKGVDVRTVGSGSTGATNVLRAAGKGPAAFVFFFDIFKGWLAVTVGIWVTTQVWPSGGLPDRLDTSSVILQYALLPPLCGFLCVLGHSRSIFLKFGGGKSAATALGGLIGLNYLCAGSTFAVWLIVLGVGRIVSLASIAAGLAAPITMYLAGGAPSFVVYAFVAGMYVVIRHRSNMKRLIAGTEPRLGQKAADKNSESKEENTGAAKGLVIPFLVALLSLHSVCDAAPAAKKTTAKTKSPALSSTPPSPVTAEEASNIRVYKNVNKAVVNITAIGSSEDFIFGNTPVARETGSGVVLTPDGYVLTNNHVIGEAKIVKVTLHDGACYPARLVGTDPDNDLAVLKIDPAGKTLTAIRLGDSGRLEVGRRVYAIGNPFGLDLTMTSGIISSVGRTLRTDNGRLIKGVLQTDAAINPGNSGGPLLDAQGDMIGVTTAIVSKAGQSAGIGFAIPINIVKRIVPQLIQYHAVIRPDTGILAVRPVEFNGNPGLMIAKLDPDGPAANAGLKGPEIRVTKNAGFTMYQVDNSAADIIVKVDSVRVQSVDDFLSYVETKKPGQVVTLSVLSKGKLREVSLKLAPGAPTS
jgi:acyl-phosphate glycerol 3-phosphate acyltransferase